MHLTKCNQKQTNFTWQTLQQQIVSVSIKTGQFSLFFSNRDQFNTILTRLTTRCFMEQIPLACVSFENTISLSSVSWVSSVLCIVFEAQAVRKKRQLVLQPISYLDSTKVNMGGDFLDLFCLQLIFLDFLAIKPSKLDGKPKYICSTKYKLQTLSKYNLMN